MSDTPVPLAVLDGMVVDINDERAIGFIQRPAAKRVVVKHNEAFIELTTDAQNLAEGDQVCIVVVVAELPE